MKQQKSFKLIEQERQFRSRGARNQSHYREVLRWEIFMEQELRFGLDVGRLALLKKTIWSDYEQLLWLVLFKFSWSKINK